MGVHVLGGLDFDADPASWKVMVDGWDSPTGSSLVVTQRAQGDGGWPSSPYGTPRNLVIKGSVTVNDPADLEDALERFGAALSLNGALLTITRYGRARSMTVYRLAQPDIVRYPSPNYATFTAQVVAPDPRKFGVALSGSTHLPSSSGGLTVPFTVPFTLNSSVVNGQVSLVNPGTTRGPVLINVAGALPGSLFSIAHTAGGVQRVFSMNLPLNTGEFVLIDMENEQALAQGQASRSTFITSLGWSGFDPGPNVWAFSAQTYSAAALMTVTATPAW